MTAILGHVAHPPPLFLTMFPVCISLLSTYDCVKKKEKKSERQRMFTKTLIESE